MKKIESSIFFKTCITISVFLASVSVFYYFVIFKPSLEKTKQDQKRHFEEARINLLRLEGAEKKQVEKKIREHKQSCNKYALEVAIAIYDSKMKSFDSTYEGNKYIPEDYEHAYTSCLRKYGY